MEQKPSVGRIVHYYLPEHDAYDDRGPFAAVISRVNVGGTVRLHVMISDDDQPVAEVVGVSYAEEPKPGCWTWPPRV